MWPVRWRSRRPTIRWRERAIRLGSEDDLDYFDVNRAMEPPLTARPSVETFGKQLSLRSGACKNSPESGMIETLENSRRSEVVEVIGAAFRAHPLLPPDPSGGKARLLATAILDAFNDAPDARFFGIHREGRLDCAAFVYDSAYEPRGLTLIVFLIRMIRVAGWRMTRTFAQVLSEKPEGEERRLELMLLGTRAGCQKLGLGRAMMYHIFAFARDRGYQSVVLGVAKETPAFGFYLCEGFRVEREIALPTMPLCMLRCPLAEQESEYDAAASEEMPNQWRQPLTRRCGKTATRNNPK